MYPVGPVIFVLLRIVRWLNTHAVATREQNNRNSLAEEIAKRVECSLVSGWPPGHELPKFALYLRPFVLEGMLRQIRHWTLIPPFPIMSYFDRILQDHLTPLGITLISIGPRNEREGAGHLVTSESVWRERFRHLAASATIIIVVPGKQPGIRSEIRWLKMTGLLPNTVFFKPNKYPMKDWEEMQHAYREEDGIQLPAYSAKPLSFRIQPSGLCHEVLTWHSVYKQDKKLRGLEQMRALLSNRPMEF